MKKRFLSLAMLLAVAINTHAVEFVATTADNRLVRFDSSAPGTLLSSVAITGLVAADGITADPNAVLVNLALNAANGLFYGLDSNANFYRVGLDGSTSLLDNTFAPTGFTAGFAYDSFTDRFLFASEDAESVLISATGARTANPALVYGAGDPNATFTPSIFGLGIDAFTGESYFVDAQRGVLAISIDPTFSELFTVGSLGTSFTAYGGLTVDEDGGVWGAFSTDGLTSSLYTINSDSGQASLVDGFGGAGINSLVAVPEPSIFVLFGIGFAVALFRLRGTRTLA